MSRRVPPGFSDWPATLPVPLYGPYRAVVAYVVDGDTLDVVVDVGLGDYPYRTVRLLAAVDGALVGIDCPEKNRKETKVAGLAAMAYTVAVCPPGAQVLVSTELDPDSFGRYLGTVRLHDHQDLGSALLEAGHARLRTYKITHPTGAPVAVTPREVFTLAQVALAKAHRDLVDHERAAARTTRKDV